MTTTPKKITSAILDLCKKLDDTQKPIFVPVQPVAGALKAECYPNVATQIKNNGGSIQYGWIIWENPNEIIEGEFHACWKDNAGQCIDITPKSDGETQILFLPDSKRVYNGTPINNVREILTTNPNKRALFKMQEKLGDLRIKYNVDGKQSNIPIEELRKIGMNVSAGGTVDMRDGQFAQMNGGTVEPAKSNKVGRNDPCTCGSGIKYKKCCGK